MHLKKGMNVKVISGNNKGQSGKILEVFPKEMKAIVEGVNSESALLDQHRIIHQVGLWIVKLLFIYQI